MIYHSAPTFCFELGSLAHRSLFHSVWTCWMAGNIFWPALTPPALIFRPAVSLLSPMAPSPWMVCRVNDGLLNLPRFLASKRVSFVTQDLDEVTYATQKVITVNEVRQCVSVSFPRISFDSYASIKRLLQYLPYLPFASKCNCEWTSVVSVTIVPDASSTFTRGSV